MTSFLLAAVFVVRGSWGLPVREFRPYVVVPPAVVPGVMTQYVIPPTVIYSEPVVVPVEVYPAVQFRLSPPMLSAPVPYFSPCANGLCPKGF